MVGARSGIMAKSRQAEVRSWAVEKRKRSSITSRIVPDAIGDLVADVRELIGRKGAREHGCGNVAKVDTAAVEDIGIGNLAFAAPDRHLDCVVRNQVLQLGLQIFPEQGRTSDARRIRSPLGQPRERPVRMRSGPLAAIGDAKLRISEAACGTISYVRRSAGTYEFGQRLSKVRDRLV